MNSLIRTQPWLGTLVTIQLEAQAARAELLQWSQCAFAAIKATHLEFNLHCGQSELSWVNKVAAIGWATISAELMEILEY